MEVDGADLTLSCWLFGEVFVGELDGDGALPDGGGDAFDGPVAHVSGGEDAGQAGLQKQWWAPQRPSGGRRRSGSEVAPGQNVALLADLFDLPTDWPPGQPAGSYHVH
jgi:hypothetical protein